MTEKTARPLPPTEDNRLRDFCLLVLTGIALTMALIYTRPVLVPLSFAVFVYVVTTPFLRWLNRRLKMPRAAAIALTFLVVFVTLALLVLLVATSLDAFFQGAHVYKDRILSFLDSIVVFAESYGIEINDQLLRREVSSLPFFSFARTLTGGVFSFFGNFTLVIVFIMFLLLGERRQAKKPYLFEEVQNKVSRYVATKLLTSLSTGVLVGAILVSYGVELAFMFAVLTMLLNFIPSIGSVIATILPIPVLLLQFGLTWPFWIVLGLTSLVQFSIGNGVEPKMLGESLELHPIAVLFFLIFWGLVWGIPGMFLAVPITAVLRIVFQKFEATRPVSDILAGRWPAGLMER